MYRFISITVAAWYLFGSCLAVPAHAERHPNRVMALADDVGEARNLDGDLRVPRIGGCEGWATIGRSETEGSVG